MPDPIRARLDRTDPPGMCCRAADALRAVLDLCDASCALVEREAITEAIAEHLGVDGA